MAAPGTGTGWETGPAAPAAPAAPVASVGGNAGTGTGTGWETAPVPTAPVAPKSPLPSNHSGIFGFLAPVSSAIGGAAHWVASKSALAGSDIKQIPTGLYTMGNDEYQMLKATAEHPLANPNDPKYGVNKTKASKEMASMIKGMGKNAITTVEHPLRDPFNDAMWLLPAAHGLGRVGIGAAEAGGALRAGEGLGAAAKALRDPALLRTPRMINEPGREPVSLYSSRNAARRLVQAGIDRGVNKALANDRASGLLGHEGPVAAYGRARMGGTVAERARAGIRYRQAMVAMTRLAGRGVQDFAKKIKADVADPQLTAQALLHSLHDNVLPEHEAIFHEQQAAKGINVEQNTAWAQAFGDAAKLGVARLSEDNRVVVNEDHPLAAPLAKADNALAKLGAYSENEIVSRGLREQSLLTDRNGRVSQLVQRGMPLKEEPLSLREARRAVVNASDKHASNLKSESDWRSGKGQKSMEGQSVSPGPGLTLGGKRVEGTPENSNPWRNKVVLSGQKLEEAQQRVRALEDRHGVSSPERRAAQAAGIQAREQIAEAAHRLFGDQAPQHLAQIESFARQYARTHDVTPHEFYAQFLRNVETPGTIGGLPGDALGLLAPDLGAHTFDPNVAQVHSEGLMSDVGAAENALGLKHLGTRYQRGIWRGKENIGEASHIEVGAHLTPEIRAKLDALATAHGLMKGEDSVSWGRPQPAGAGEFQGIHWNPPEGSNVANDSAAFDKANGEGLVGFIHAPDGGFYVIDFGGNGADFSTLDGVKTPIGWDGSYVIRKALATVEPESKTFEHILANNPGLESVINAPRTRVMSADVAEKLPESATHLYHGTTPESAAQIMHDGILRATRTERAPEESAAWLSSHPSRAAFQGRSVVEIPREALNGAEIRQHPLGMYSSPEDVALHRPLPESTALYSHESFHDAAAAELQKYAAMARDVAKTIPEAEWPAWVRNQIRMQSSGELEKMLTDASSSGTTFPEEWLHSMMPAEAGGKILGSYSPSTATMRLSEQHAVPETMLHEAMHAVRQSLSPTVQEIARRMYAPHGWERAAEEKFVEDMQRAHSGEPVPPEVQRLYQMMHQYLPGRGYVPMTVWEDSRTPRAPVASAPSPVVSEAKIPLNTHTATGEAMAQGLRRTDVAEAVTSHVQKLFRYFNTVDHRELAARHGSATRLSSDDVLMRYDRRTEAGFKLPAGRVDNVLKEALGILENKTGLPAPEEEGLNAGVSAALKEMVGHIFPKLGDDPELRRIEETATRGAKAPAGYVWVPKQIARLKDLESSLARGESGKIGRFADNINGAVTAATVYYKFGHIFTRVFTNASANIMQGSMAPWELARSVALKSALTDDEVMQTLAYAGTHYFEAAPGATGSTYIGRGMQKGLHIPFTDKAWRTKAGTAVMSPQWWAHNVDAPFRFNSIAYEARLAGYDGVDGFRRFLHEVDNYTQLDPEGRARVDGVLRRGDREAIAYDRLNQFEKKYLARAIWFYPWIKGSTVFTANSILEHPFKAAPLGLVGSEANQRTQAELGDMPSYAHGLTLLTHGLEPIVSDMNTFSPFSTSADLMNIPEHPGNIGGMLNPAYGAALGVAEGVNPYGAKTPTPIVDNVKGLLSSAPEYQIAAAALDHSDQSHRLYPGGHGLNPLYKNWLGELLRAFGSPATPRYVNPEAGHSLAQRERTGR